MKMKTIIDMKVSTGKKEFSIIWKEEQKILLVETTQNPEKGKANKEIVKELKKFFDADTEIIFGKKSKEKKLQLSLEKAEVEKKLAKAKDKLIL
jgi:uncharacterized protein (TIGR00251 family)